MLVRALNERRSYKRIMSKPPPFDWYLTDWMAATGTSQADMQRIAGWSKRKASDLCTGVQRFNRDSLNEAADALHIYPFELLLHPADAQALRQLREGAVRLVDADQSGEFPSRPHLKAVGE